MSDQQASLQQALWRIYNRPVPPTPWAIGGNLPWNDPTFSERMLREHLSEAHGAATRQMPERRAILDWMWALLNLRADHHILDITCGPGLYAVPYAQQGCRVTGIDFGPAAIQYANDLALTEGVADRCHFIEADIREMKDLALPAGSFDAAHLLYGQLAVFTRAEAQAILQQLARLLKPGAKLCLELLNPEAVDKTNSSWWYTDEGRLWGERPFLHLGERYWDETTHTSTERFFTIDLEHGAMDVVHLCDVVYQPGEMTRALQTAGFANVQIHPNWGDLALYDKSEWLVYIAERL